MIRTVIAVLAILSATPALASWQLIPGKPYDGRFPRSVYREPCWSAASSKCAYEQSVRPSSTIKTKRR